jgi:hypothetical protein
MFNWLLSKYFKNNEKSSQSILFIYFLFKLLLKNFKPKPYSIQLNKSSHKQQQIDFQKQKKLQEKIDLQDDNKKNYIVITFIKPPKILS